MLVVDDDLPCENFDVNHPDVPWNVLLVCDEIMPDFDFLYHKKYQILLIVKTWVYKKSGLKTNM